MQAKIKRNPSFIDFSVKEGWKVDSWLLTACLLIMAFSIFVVFSASNESSTMISSHIVRNVIAVGVFIIVSRIQVTYFKQLSMKFYVVVLILLMLVPLVGDLRMGARRWLDLGFVSFQPSELAKLAVPMACAVIVSRFGLFNNTKNILMGLVIVLAPAALIVRQPDLGTAIMVAGSGLAVMLFSGLSLRLIFGAGGCLIATAPYLWTHLKPYQQERVLSAFNPERDPLGAGYHVIQSKAAIGSGGSDGVGWLNGVQTHLGFIPEQHTDFIFAVIGEELGFSGFILMMSLYAILFGRLAFLMFKTDDLYAKSFTASVISILFAYLFVNIGMVTGLLPVVGVPLPLISYGGTSTVSIMCGVGIVSAFSAQKMKKVS
ncbi:rod shape-determining protein RodA [Vibrio sp. D431a]|uniref:rod shape-determining protein RodA n=1 Tax=Vibrio sp. D431a TaxID=2837388 RepID=UPI002557916D|nr:rod shape-determining protein RodA [Vibrio sp. D431a]